VAGLREGVNHAVRSLGQSLRIPGDGALTGRVHAPIHERAIIAARDRSSSLAFTQETK